MTFVSASKYRKSLEAVGCTYVPLEGPDCDWSEIELLDLLGEERNAIPPGPMQIAYDMEIAFVNPIPGQHAAMQRAMAMLTQQHPGRPIIQLCEGFFQGAIPISLGANGTKPTATVGLGIIPILLNSIDCAPFGPGLPPDSSLEGQARNKAMTAELNEAFFGKPLRVWTKIMTDLGADLTTYQSFLDAPYLAQDRFLQMCIPSIEYPRSDAPSTIRFTGGLPKGSRDPMIDPPAWWNEVVENKEGKDIIFVCQGTVAKNHNDLNIPTMEALSTRSNTLVIVALGTKGEVLSPSIPIPYNARVIDFLPFDEILPYVKVFITNGGYGALQHGIANGSPLLMAGAGEDKPEVSMRAEWAGLAVNLKTGTPSREAIRNGVEEVIGNGKYKKRAVELQEEMAQWDPMGIVVETIEELAKKKDLK